MRSKNAQAYDACPFCLAEITVEKDHESDEEIHGLDSAKARSEVINVIPLEEKTAEPSSRKSECAHHLGYLSKRQAKEKIPEECMMCENIVQCMLKGVTC